MESALFEKATKKQWMAVAGGLLGSFMAVLDISITNASLKDIQGGLSATLDEGAWMSTAYLMAEIIVVPLSGWLSRVFGLKRYLFWSAVVFVIASMLCGLAWNLGSMIAFRALQGFTGGVLIPFCVTIIMTYLPKGQQPLGLSLFTLAISFAPCIGPTVGGWLTVNYSWSFIFYVNLIPGLFLCYLVSRGLEDQPAELGLFTKGDWGGILSMALALGSLTVVLEEGVRKDWWGSGLIRDLSVLSAVSFAVFLYLELTQPEPFINLRLLKRRNFLLAALAGMVFGAGTYGSIFIIPLFLARITGLDAEQTGGIIMWAGLPQLFIIPFFPLLVKRFDSRLLSAFGFALFGLSLFMNSGLTADWGHDQFFWSQIVRAVGQPFIMTPLLGLAYVGVEASEMGSASGLFNMMRDLGGTLGIGLIGTLLDNRYHLHFTRIAEAVSRFSPQASIQVAHRAEFLAGRSPWGGLSQSLATVFDTMNRQAFVMAFADCFFAMALVFVVSVSLVLMMKKAAAPAGPRADH